jgi:hypothetical protein
MNLADMCEAVLGACFAYRFNLEQAARLTQRLLDLPELPHYVQTRAPTYDILLLEVYRPKSAHKVIISFIKKKWIIELKKHKKDMLLF